LQLYIYVFFFQAEDGIRDRNVTGVQTCALPICPVFEATRQSALIKQILCDTPDCKDLPEPLRTVVARCLQKDPEQRPTARELIDLLTVTPPTTRTGPTPWTNTVVPQTPLCHRNDDLFGSRPRSSGPTGAFLFAGRHHG